MINILNFNSVIIFSDDPKNLAEFYQKIIGRKPDMNEGEFKGFLIGTTFLSIGKHDKVKGKSKNPERIMLNFETTDVKGEFDRIKKLGAEVIAEPYKMGDAWIATLADPDGNYFQLVTPWGEMKN